MVVRRSLFISLFLNIGVATLLFLSSQTGLLRRLELGGLDFSFRRRGNLSKGNPPIIIIEITDTDILKIGRWPWPRSWHAALTKALKELGVKYIYFDIIFSEPASEEEDSLLEEAIKQIKNVYLPFVFQNNYQDNYDIKESLLPLARFASHIKGTGALNIYPDIDGIIRRIPLLFKLKDGTYSYHIALKIAMDYLGYNIKEIKPSYLLLNSHNKKEIKVPLVDRHSFLINWQGKWQETFKHYGFLDVVAGYKDVSEGKNSSINPQDFKDSICLVGVTAIGLYDIKPIPLQPEYPGIGIIATTIANLLDRDFLYPLSFGVNILILYIISIIPAFLILGEKPLREISMGFLLVIGYILLNLLLFKNRIVLNLSLHLLGIITCCSISGAYNFIRLALEKQRFFKMAISDGLTNLFNIKYFKILLNTEIIMAKNDPTKTFSLIMADIDHFKHFNDNYGHQIGDLVLKEVATILKSSVRSSDIVARYGGEEMIILLRGSLLKDAVKVAEKIRKNVEQNIIKDQDNTYKVTISMGVSTFRVTDNLESVIKRADNALYKAKRLGRNRVEVEEEY